MPSLCRKPNGVWYVDYVDKLGPTRYRRSLRTRSEAIAQERYKKWLEVEWPFANAEVVKSSEDGKAHLRFIKS